MEYIIIVCPCKLQVQGMTNKSLGIFSNKKKTIKNRIFYYILPLTLYDVSIIKNNLKLNIHKFELSELSTQQIKLIKLISRGLYHL